MKVRLKFEKYGPIRFIGHLDVMRYFQKVMRRADVDIAYSEGYSPHQLMSFAQPLTVGATSDAEYLDMTLNTPMEMRDLTERLNAVMHEGIRITDAAVLEERAEKAMAAVYACKWRVSFRQEYLDTKAPALTVPELQRRTEALLASSEVIVQKKTKKGQTDVNLRPLIYDMRVDHEGVFTMLLKAGSEGNVKPAVVMGLLAEDAEVPQSALVLHRLETYLCTEPDGRRCLEPLISHDETERIALS